MSSVYGDWLKAQREARGMTQQELAEAAVMTRTHIAHIEAGRRIPSKQDARRLDRALGTGDVLTSFLPKSEEDIKDYFEAALELEKQATEIREFAVSYMPGVLQTRRYARAVFGSAYPPRSQEECDEVVVTRLERAKILEHPVTPGFWALIDEQVLRRPVGGPEVMAEQITHVVDLAECGRVRVHVVPMSLGLHPLLKGMLSLMWFEDQPPVAYSEGIGMGGLLDSPDLVQRLQGAYALTLADALPMQESLALMGTIAKEYGHHD